MKTQQCCALVGALLCAAAGLGLVLVARSLSADIVLQHVTPGFSSAALLVGAGALASGCIGTLGALLTSRLLLCLYGVCALVAAVAGLAVGAGLMATAGSRAEGISRSCLLHQGAPAEWSEHARAYQRSYDSMKDALRNCRRNGRPTALGLQDCGQLARDSRGRWFEEEPNLDLFLWLEGESGCGGLCEGDVALFAMPETPGGKAVDQSDKVRRREPCFHRLAGELRGRGGRRGGLVLLLSAPILASVCAAAWILCSPPPGRRKDYLRAGGHSDEDDRGPESDRLLCGSGGSSASGESDEEQ